MYKNTVQNNMWYNLFWLNKKTKKFQYGSIFWARQCTVHTLRTASLEHILFIYLKLKFNVTKIHSTQEKKSI